MAALMKCHACKGRKIIMSLGGIYKDCKICLGVGHIKIVEPEEEYKILNKKTRKKRLTNAEYEAIKKKNNTELDSEKASSDFVDDNSKSISVDINEFEFVPLALEDVQIDEEVVL